MIWRAAITRTLVTDTVVRGLSFHQFCLFSKPAPNLNYVCAPRLLVLLVGACPLLSPQGLAPLLFGLWNVRFPPALVRTGRRLPVEALCESGVLGRGGCEQEGWQGGEKCMFITIGPMKKL